MLDYRGCIRTARGGGGEEISCVDLWESELESGILVSCFIGGLCVAFVSFSLRWIIDISVLYVRTFFCSWYVLDCMAMVAVVVAVALVVVVIGGGFQLAAFEFGGWSVPVIYRNLSAPDYQLGHVGVICSRSFLPFTQGVYFEFVCGHIYKQCCFLITNCKPEPPCTNWYSGRAVKALLVASGASGATRAGSNPPDIIFFCFLPSSMHTIFHSLGIQPDIEVL